METNPFLGVGMWVLAGLCGACFYLPFRRVKQWAWESYWLVYTVAGLLLLPCILAMVFSPNLLSVLHQVSWETLFWCYAFGAMWGVGNLTWGLMIRYLGVGLGLAVGCGVCASVGTLAPPLFCGKLPALVAQPGGIVTLVGVGIGLLGIILTGSAGMSKERELSDEQKKAVVADFNFSKGIVVALFSGVMSAGMNFGITAGQAIDRVTVHTKPTTEATWQGIPTLVVVLLGGFTVNFLWSLFLSAKNRSGGDYMKRGAPRTANVLFAVAAGLIWYAQFALLSIGNAKSAGLLFAGWTVFLGSVVIFSTLLGIFMREWQGVSRRTKSLLAASLLVLVVALVVIGYGSYLKPDITTGTVADVNVATLVVRTADGAQKTFDLDPKSMTTKVVLDDRPADTADLKVGQAVEVVKSHAAPLTIRASSKKK
jgi:L-rhamnose-H+ transport protein